MTVFILMGISGFYSGQTQAGPYLNPLLSFTHILPSPLTLPAGRFVLGSTVGIGVTDWLELDTNLVADLYQIYNGRAQVSLLDFPGLAAGFYLGYQNTNLNALSAANPAISLSTFMPGMVIGMEMLPHFAWFLGGNLSYTNASVPTSGLDVSGFLQGGQIGSDFSWAYNSGESQVGNVLSAGFSYNSTFGIYGVGLSHHWRGFHVGLHYYPNANNLKVMPILSGGAVVDI